jgi:predicted amidohydrolase YtcJ
MASAQGSKGADSIYRGGEIVTVNDRQPAAQAVAVRNGLIVAVGDDEAVMKLRGFRPWRRTCWPRPMGR